MVLDVVVEGEDGLGGGGAGFAGKGKEFGDDGTGVVVSHAILQGKGDRSAFG